MKTKKLNVTLVVPRFTKEMYIEVVVEVHEANGEISFTPIAGTIREREYVPDITD
jgi:hypothetical protein